VGRQAASHLAQMEATRELDQARQFEAFNRMSAFVVHDIKNLVSQLTLVVSNAARHKHNPRFMEDVVHTVSNSVSRMNRLLEHLRTGGQARSETADVNLAELLTEVVRHLGAGSPPIMLDCSKETVLVRADRDRLASVIGHVVQNARDATPPEGRIAVRMRIEGRFVVLDVEDTGCGMDEAFIREQLFKPFKTTKGEAGMGIGAFETREYIRSLGGDVEVSSRPGQGTLFRLRMPFGSSPVRDISFGTGNVS
jgi:putative PEP-CTERM system histidine kinase